MKNIKEKQNLRVYMDEYGKKEEWKEILLLVKAAHME